MCGEAVDGSPINSLLAHCRNQVEMCKNSILRVTHRHQDETKWNDGQRKYVAAKRKTLAKWQGWVDAIIELKDRNRA